MSWTEAVLYCEENSAMLASIHSEEENQYIGGLIEKNTWIGLNDIEDEHVWEWVDGSPFDYSKWHVGEPNHSTDTGDYAVEIYFNKDTWNDRQTTSMNLPPICKYVNTETCNTVKATCYGSGAFGAECNGPISDINFPVTLKKASSSYQRESKGTTESHVEIFPLFPIDLTGVARVRLDIKINDITGGAQYGSIFTLGAKYDECGRELFTLTQHMWQTTVCANNKWHSWEIVLLPDAIEIHCDEVTVWNHIRVDSQDSWEKGDESPYLAIGGFYSSMHTAWYSRSDMVVQNVEVLTCETAAPSPSPTKLPTQIPTAIPTSKCDVLTVLCYGEGAFGADCNGPTTDVDYPEILTKSQWQGGKESPGNTNSHIEIYPSKAIELSSGTRISFDAQIYDITPGLHYGSVFALSVIYEQGQKAVYTLTWPIWETTSCNDTSWHSWEMVVHSDSVNLYCDENLVATEKRTDTQNTWQPDDKAPFLAIGAHYAPQYDYWYCRVDMIVQNVKIFTCDYA